MRRNSLKQDMARTKKKIKRPSSVQRREVRLLNNPPFDIDAVRKELVEKKNQADT